MKYNKGRCMKRKSTMKRYIAVFLVICFVFIPAVCCVFYNQRVRLAEEFEAMVAANLTSYTQSQKRYLNSAITDVRNTLEGVSGLLDQAGLLEDPEGMKRYLDELNRINTDYTIEYRPLDELKARLCEPRTPERDRVLFEMLEKGQGVVSDIWDSETVENRPVFTVAEPVMKDGLAVGILRTTLDPMAITGQVPEASAFKTSSTLIIRKDGLILSCDNDGYKETAASGLFTSVKAAGISGESVDFMREQFQEEESGSILFGGKKKEYYFSWEPLGYNDWYMVNFVRSPDVVIHYDNILEGLIYTSLFLILLTVALGGGIMVLALRHRQNLDLEEKKYGLLAEFSDTVLFEYDNRTDTLEFTNNARKILLLKELVIHHATRKDGADGLFLPEDRPVMMEMLKGREKSAGEHEIQYEELRFKSISGEYHWFGCHYKTITSYSGLAVKVVGKLADISRQRIREQVLREQAMRDVLTDTYNKAGEQLISGLLKGQESGLFLMLDLDDFKGVNDTKGHAAGDAILAEVGKVLKKACREDDIVARIGGDEFVLFLPGPFDREAADRKVAEIQERLLEVKIPAWGVRGIRASIGAALCPEEGRDYDALYQASDVAMYQVKAQSKDRETDSEDKVQA